MGHGAAMSEDHIVPGYTLRDIPGDFWADVKWLSARRRMSIKTLIFRGLQTEIDRERSMVAPQAPLPRPKMRRRKAGG